MIVGCGGRLGLLGANLAPQLLDRNTSTTKPSEAMLPSTTRRPGLGEAPIARSTSWASFALSSLQSGLQSFKDSVLGADNGAQKYSRKRAAEEEERLAGSPKAKRARRTSPKRAVGAYLDPPSQAFRQISPRKSDVTRDASITNASQAHANGMVHSRSVLGSEMSWATPSDTSVTSSRNSTPRRARAHHNISQRPGVASFSNLRLVDSRPPVTGREYTFNGMREVSMGAAATPSRNQSMIRTTPQAQSAAGSIFGPIPQRTQRDPSVPLLGMRSVSPTKPTLDRPANTGPWARGTTEPAEREMVRVGTLVGVPPDPNRPLPRDYTKFSLDPQLGIVSHEMPYPTQASRALDSLDNLYTPLQSSRITPSLSIPNGVSRFSKKVKVPLPSDSPGTQRQKARETLASARARIGSKANRMITPYSGDGNTRKILMKRKEEEKAAVVENSEDVEFTTEPSAKPGKENERPAMEVMEDNEPVPSITNSMNSKPKRTNLKFPLSGEPSNKTNQQSRPSSFRPSREPLFRSHQPAPKQGKFSARDVDEAEEEEGPSVEELKKVAESAKELPKFPAGFKIEFGKKKEDAEMESVSPRKEVREVAIQSESDPLSSPIKAPAQPFTPSLPAPLVFPTATVLGAPSKSVEVSAPIPDEDMGDVTPTPPVESLAPPVIPNPAPAAPSTDKNAPLDKLPFSFGLAATSAPLPVPTSGFFSGLSTPAASVENPASTGFTFDAPPAKPAESKPSFTFGAPPSKPAENKPSFTFGAPPNPVSEPAKPFIFGAPPTTATDKPVTAPGTPSFTFGAPPSITVDAGTPVQNQVATPLATPALPTFSFGSKESTPVPTIAPVAPATESKPSFTFGGAPTAPAPSESKPSFVFGAPSVSTTAQDNSPSKPFTFGAPASSAASSPAKPFSFGTSTPAPTPTTTNAPFSFGGPPATTPVAQPPAPAASGFTFTAPPVNNPFSKPVTPETREASPFTFGAPAAPPSGNASTPFTFGAKPTPTLNTAPTPFTFGSAAPTPVAAPPSGNPFTFGTPAPTPTTTTPGFTFGAPVSVSTPAQATLSVDTGMNGMETSPGRTVDTNATPTPVQNGFAFGGAGGFGGGFGAQQTAPVANNGSRAGTPFGAAPSSPFIAPGAAPSSPFTQNTALSGFGQAVVSNGFGQASPAASPFTPTQNLFGSNGGPGGPFPSNASDAGSDAGGARRLLPLPKRKGARTASETRSALAKFHGRT